MKKPIHHILTIMSLITVIELSFFGWYTYPRWMNTLNTLLPKRATSETKTLEKQLPPYMVMIGKAHLGSFFSLDKAIHYAQGIQHSTVTLANGGAVIWNHDAGKQRLDPLQVPFFAQYPELPRGCEVTSLAMLLTYRGYQTDKMKLAKEIDFDSTPLTVDKNGTKWWGNPYKGFVGDMYDLKKPGFGVFYSPVLKLAKKYAGGRAINMTSLNFHDVLTIVRAKNPVWVVVNTQFTSINVNEVRWMTKDGPISTTYHQHAVLITGADDKNVYFNDPLQRYGKNAKAPIAEFQISWEQMGKQAITVTQK